MSDKGPKNLSDDNVERRKIEVHREGLEPPSSVTLYFDCPFCHTEVKAYLWSLSGGGKRCKCGAFFARSGAYHWKTEGDT